MHKSTKIRELGMPLVKEATSEDRGCGAGLLGSTKCPQIWDDGEMLQPVGVQRRIQTLLALPL